MDYFQISEINVPDSNLRLLLHEINDEFNQIKLEYSIPDNNLKNMSSALTSLLFIIEEFYKNYTALKSDLSAAESALEQYKKKYDNSVSEKFHLEDSFSEESNNLVNKITKLESMNRDLKRILSTKSMMMCENSSQTLQIFKVDKSTMCYDSSFSDDNGMPCATGNCDASSSILDQNAGNIDTNISKQWITVRRRKKAKKSMKPLDPTINALNNSETIVTADKQDAEINKTMKKKKAMNIFTVSEDIINEEQYQENMVEQLLASKKYINSMIH
ncbi:hypothetical protein O3M35_000603 [Rhynocoris fuscipes]|uniref:Uncharacterized protein n=1 Tax=Rhynocoris fuscipes TaxID=488301 RepID=A0AAW1DM81_9HEMI